MTRIDQAERRGRQRGVVLIVVLLISVALASLALTYTRAMRVELLAARNAEASAQARAIAEAAAQGVMALGDALPVEAVEVAGGAFWILRPDPETDLTHAFGIVDESARVNVNSASEEMLLGLPEMNEDLAGAIIDWRDSDDEISAAGGAESEYYLIQPDPYRAKHAPLETVEELLLLRGHTPLELYGEDANRNGVLNANETDGDASSPPDDADGELDRGLLPFVTVYSREPNRSTDAERFNVNSDDGQGELETYLTSLWGDARADEITDRIRDGRPHRHAIDLFYKTEMTLEEFAAVADRLSYGNRPSRVGLINVNTAPRQVLLTLPTITESEADALIAHRGEPPPAPTSVGNAPAEKASPDVTRNSVAWVTQVLTREQAMAIGGLITTRSYQRSADIVAVAPGGRAFERYRLVYDTSEGEARVLLWQRLTHLGWPLDRQLLEALRNGTPVDKLPRGNDGRSL